MTMSISFGAIARRPAGGVVEPLQVIAAPRRLRILELVWDRELAAGEIAAQFEVSWSAISQHLTVLKAAGFVIERRAGRARFYCADQAALGSLRSIVEEHWRGGLDRLKALAEAEQRDQDRQT
jgi:DNA-binding transcriptional ArsR family regulator